MKMIDYRSDTITQPTHEMRKAMAEAPVGDDVYGEDPTVRQLEEKAAELMGKECALFVVSGTMGNQLAVKTHTHPGDEIILEKNSHIFYYEVGAIGALSGVQSQQIKGNHGRMNPQDIREAIREDNIHFPKTSLICLENTHNKSGGTVIPLEDMKHIYEIGQSAEIPIHLDGARIFNACTYLKTNVKNIAQYADSIMFALSKGLCAPIGSILVGNKSFIQKARKYRKMFGGGMRQAGIIAAAGIVALDQMVSRLDEDHYHARILAEGLNEFQQLSVDMKTVQTNIIMCDMIETSLTSAQMTTILKQEGVLCTSITEKRIRLVTHYHIRKEDVHDTLQIIKNVLTGK
ncbi:MAG: low-specificity L-threonine aldolase [Eubacteriales bacterium]